MKMLKQALKMCLILSIVGTAFQVKAEDYIPWDELTEDSWIDFFDGNDPNIYPVNAQEAADIDFSYPISFSQASGKAKGMNALKFIYGGRTEGHLVSRDLAGSFQIKNNGDNSDNTFTTLLLLVAINTEFLENDFTVKLNLREEQPCVLDVNDFGYYDNQYGRPSGYYSATDPNNESLTYAFNKGMVTVYGVENMPPLAIGDSIVIDYEFSDLPGPAVFSVYGYIGTEPAATIYHTNKAFLDNKDIGGDKNLISTFAVTVRGDLDGDLDVDLDDFAVFSGNWLVGVE